jgi:molybdate transport system substrate-binding protein
VVAALSASFAAAACDGSSGSAGDRPTIAIGLGPVLDGAGPDEKASGQITVAAAADLRNVLSGIQPEIERQCQTRLTVVYGSSGQLKNQIEAGADFGLYLSADSQYPVELAANGLVVPNGVAAYAVGRLALATRSGIEPLVSLEGLTSGAIRRIAIANPGHAPYGRAAKQALEASGLYGAVEGKLVLGENIRQTTDYVEKGDADAAIVALALVIQGSPASYTLIDSSLHEPIEQGGAVIKGTGAELTGRCVLQYLLDRAGQLALRESGFEAVAR